MSSRSKARETARVIADFGRYIFIFNNIRTNQVVYSLQRNLNNHSTLSQLPFAGKKTIPPTLRKDIWRPFATVMFPFASQGLSAFRQLREFRKLHEHHWDINREYPMLPAAAQERLKTSKALPTMKERSKIIMDQKANTVADLAAVLKMQDEQGAKQAEEIAKEWQRLEAVAEKAKSGEVEELKRRIAEKVAKLDNKALEGEEKGELKKSILKLRLQKNRYGKAVAAVEKRRKEQAKEVIEKEVQEKVDELADESLDAEKKEVLEKHILELRQRKEELLKEIKPSGPSPQPKFGGTRKMMEFLDNPKRIYSTEGVKIRWANVLDAEYAESWPEAVEHAILGLTRHAAPDPTEPPRFINQTVFEDEPDLEDDLEGPMGVEQ